jgi:hypothetical protein
MTKRKPVTIARVQGEPRVLCGRTFTPVARAIVLAQRRGTVRKTTVEGRAGGLVYLRPIAVIEEREGQVRTWPIPDRTASILKQMALVAAAMPIVFLALVFLRRRVQDR